MLVAFRGTHSLPDWFTNIQIAKDAEPKGRVHEGFQDAFFVTALRSWQQTVRELAEQIPRSSRELPCSERGRPSAARAIGTAVLALQRRASAHGQRHGSQRPAYLEGLCRINVGLDRALAFAEDQGFAQPRSWLSAEACQAGGKIGTHKSNPAAGVCVFDAGDPLLGT